MKHLIPANSLRRLIAFGFVLAFPACSPASPPAARLQERVPILAGQQVVLHAEHAVIGVSGVPGDTLSIDAQTDEQSTPGLSVERLEDGVHIDLPKNAPWRLFPGRRDEIALGVPFRVPLKIATFDGEISIHAYQGPLEVSAVTGNITAGDIAGGISLVTPRGNIAVRNGQGPLRLLAEHGLIVIENVHGKVGSSTIMGTIRFSGRPGRSDEIRLEADHGAIEINLEKGSDLSVEVQSNSGDVICLFPGIAQDGRRCEGSLGAGEGTLWVRTVSGDITVRERSEVD